MSNASPVLLLKSHLHLEMIGTSHISGFTIKALDKTTYIIITFEINRLLLLSKPKGRTFLSFYSNSECSYSCVLLYIFVKVIPNLYDFLSSVECKICYFKDFEKIPK